MQQLPPTLFNFSTHNEDAAVEMLVVDALGGSAGRALRVLSVAGCGTHVVTMCSSPDVATICWRAPRHRSRGHGDARPASCGR